MKEPSEQHPRLREQAMAIVKDLRERVGTADATTIERREIECLERYVRASREAD